MADDFTLDTRMFEKDAKRVLLQSKNALGEAVRYTLDRMAYQAYASSKRALKGQFTIRNTWTSRNMAFVKVEPTARRIDEMQSEAGSRLEYMEAQQEGSKHRAKGKHGVPIPTTHASGEGAAKQRKKRVQKRFYLSRLKIGKGLYADAKAAAAGDRKQHYAIMLSMARKRRLKFVYWESARGTKGLYKIRDPRNREDWAIEMVYDLSQRMTSAKPRDWLTPAADKATESLRKTFGAALSFQMRKLAK